jgi:NAD(P)-dependent dehydrogenase (short-subunit alcohol dehydrogenase family)
VGDPAAIRRLVDATVERYGGLDIVVNNAATNPAFGPVIAVDEGLFDKIYEINVKGPFMVAKAAQPIMAARGGGVIVNIASMAGLSPEPMLGFYSVSKAALIMLTKVLAAEWGAANIRVNAVLPGLIKTKFSRALWENDAILKRTLDQQAIPTLGEPEDVAGIVAFLASDAARFMTGGLYTVDGGYTI